MLETMLQEEKDTLEKQMSVLKTLNLNLEINLHRQQNKEIQPTEQRAISRQLTYRTDQERERKEITKTQEMKEISKIYATHVSQTIMKSKTMTQGKISLLLTKQADE